MSKITYTNKSGTITPSLPDYEIWRDDDANEVKTVVNDNDDDLARISESGLLTVNTKLDLISGYFVNSAQSPITTTIPIDLTGAIQGGDAAVWYKGPVIDDSTFTGANVIIISGSNVLNELCCVFIMYDQRSNGVMVNIMSGISTPPTGPSATAPIIEITDPTTSPNATPPTITVT